MNKNTNKTIQISFLFTLITLLTACGGGSTTGGGREDTSAGTVTLTSHNNGEEVIGTTTITWDNDEPNRSYIDIEFSKDSGTTFQVIENNVPDTGSYNWDSNTEKDCQTCRIQITATDVVGNVSDPISSSVDFSINNVPHVTGHALLYNTSELSWTNKDIFCDDQIIIPFDKDIQIQSLITRDFSLPVSGDRISGSNIFLGPESNEITIKLSNTNCYSDDIHLHLGGNFSEDNKKLTAPSGINISSILPTGAITAVDTGRNAEVSTAGGSIDIIPTFNTNSLNNRTIFNTDAVAVELADMDQNGTQDLIQLTSNNDDLIFINDGNGVFADDFFPNLGDTNNTSMVVGDINGDNYPDAIVGNSVLGSIVFFNNATSGNLSWNQALDPADTRAVALEDINNDGHLDLIASNYNSGNHVYLNNGSGVFTNTSQSLGSYNSLSVALADIDKDGDIDIVEGTTNANHIYLNDSSGNFIENSQLLGNSNTNTISIADIDDDNDLDIISGNSSSNKIFINDGTGVFSDSNQSLGNSDSRDISLTDYDLDNDLDIIVVNYRSGNKVWLNSGNGTFIDSNQNLGTSDSVSVAIGDIDRDGDIDFIEGNQNNQRVVVWENSLHQLNQKIMLKSGVSMKVRDVNDIAYGDLDGDGDSDIIAVTGSANHILFNTNGTFINSGQLLGTRNTYAVSVADVDADGDLDFIAGNYPGGTDRSNRVWLNNGSGVFTDSNQSLGNSYTVDITTADIDNDNDIDLITSCTLCYDSTQVWRNNGNGVFSEDVLSQQFGAKKDIDLFDIDLDGDYDLLITKTLSDEIWLNGGDSSGSNTGTFTLSQSLASSNSISIAHGDIDLDGDIDIISGSNIYLNTGTNINTTPHHSFGFVPSSIELKDVNQDKYPDIIFGVASSNGSSQILINDKNGNFSATLATDAIPSYPTTEVFADNTGVDKLIVFDIDGDNDLDLISDSNVSDDLKIWFNDY